MPTFPPLLGLLVALSGGAGLVYEMLWIRALGLHFGTTTPAVTTVVATFMAGLGLGHWWFGQRADHSPRPFALYRRLEVSIAVTGLFVSLFLLRGGTWLDDLARLCARAGSLSTLVTAMVFALLMLVPATAMGGTLPVLSRALAQHAQHAGRTLGWLYACNTAGAIAGALGPDFMLIPRYGLTLTACVAAASNALVALAMQRYVEPRDTASHAHHAQAAVTGALTRTQIAALAICGCSGFCALSLEVLWSRTLQHWAAALVTSFAVLLAVYLAALAVGALLAQRLVDRNEQPLRVAAALMGWTAVLAIVPIAWAPHWRDLERVLWPRTSGVRRFGLMHEAVDALLHASYLEVGACFVMGATFPFLAAAWLVDGKPGIRTGQLLLVNTFAGVLGALLTGFVGLPGLGEQASYCVVALLLASSAVSGAWISRQTPAISPRPTRELSALSCFVIVLALVIAMPSAQLRRAHFRSGGQVLAEQEGSTTSAAAVARFVYGEPYYVELLTPGISMSSTRPDARRYMTVMAHSALLAAPQPQRALLICYGVGNTASALLSHAGLQHLDVVDISREVLALAPRFAAARGDDPLQDSRTSVFVDDGRHHLITRDVRYDVITAEPPPPNYAGVVNLYSREFYRLAKHRLTASGVITQWLPVFQLSDDDVRAMIAAFVAELPHTALLYGYEQQLILIGSVAPLVLNVARARDPLLARSFQTNYIGTAEDLFGSVLQTDAELRRQVAGVAPLSDERPVIQYPYEDVSERTWYGSRFVVDPAHALYLLTEPIDPGMRQRVLAASAATQRAMSAVPLLALEPAQVRELALGRALQPALDARPDNEGLWALLGVDSERVKLAERALQRAGAVELLRQPRADVEARRAVPKYLVLQDALWVLARRAYYARDYARAVALLERMTPTADNKPMYTLLTSSCLSALGSVRH